MHYGIAISANDTFNAAYLLEQALCLGNAV